MLINLTFWISIIFCLIITSLKSFYGEDFSGYRLLDLFSDYPLDAIIVVITLLASLNLDSNPYVILFILISIVCLFVNIILKKKSIKFRTDESFWHRFFAGLFIVFEYVIVVIGIVLLSHFDFEK